MDKTKMITEHEQRIKMLKNEFAVYNNARLSLDTVINSLEFFQTVPDMFEREVIKAQRSALEKLCDIIRMRIGNNKIILEKLRNDVNAIEQMLVECNHCGQDAHDPCGELGTEGNPIPLPSPVDDGSAAVEDDLHESLKKLVGMQVVSVGDMPCDGCPVDHYGAPCVKVELVGGTLLCLSPLPNSIITE